MGVVSCVGVDADMGVNKGVDKWHVGMCGCDCERVGAGMCVSNAGITRPEVYC